MKLERKLLPSSIVESASDDNKEAFTSLLETLNPTLTDLSRILKGKVSFADNIACLFRAVQFTYPDTEPGTFLNGVTNYGAGERPLLAHKYDGWVDLTGLLKHSVTGGAVNIYQVSEHFLPMYREVYFPGTVDGKAAIFNLTETGILQLDSFTAASSVSKALGVSHRYKAANPENPPPAGQFPLIVDVTPLNTRPSACIVTKTEVIEGKVIRPSPPLGIVWTGTTNGKTDTVKISDFVGAIPGRRYRVGLLFLP